ncbi:hypothetical protein DPMN_181697 [Dreissena polymorpha]|uniref:Uncharacterized protein n=1 Tax=Dreissena polymorpha TaxID=45954 RepID=A0A9D4DE15_DREPO|nr:hypothetical protein DPMN_181697 [Dreissena polymorpha]
MLRPPKISKNRILNEFSGDGSVKIVVATVAFVILAGGGEGRPGWETVPCSCLSLQSFVSGRQWTERDV